MNKVDPSVQVTQMSVFALPSHTPDYLATLQHADPVLRSFLQFWRCKHPPDKKERQALSKPVKELVRQWNRMVERDGLLYRRIHRPDGGEEIHQLLLPASLREEVLQQLHQGHGHQGVERTTNLIQEPIGGTIGDWLQEHQMRLQTAFDGAKERIQAAARLRKERHDQHVAGGNLTEGEMVYLKDNSARGRVKIQDIWGPRRYKVVKTPSDGGAVYSIAPLDDAGKIKHVHRTLLRPIPLTIPISEPDSEEQGRSPTNEGDCEPNGEWWIVPQPVTATLEPLVSCPQPPAPAKSIAGTISPVDVDNDDPMEGSSTVPLRRSQRETAGRHPNPHNLPVPAWRSGREAATSRVTGSGNMLSATPRLWK
ncbi:uncharacterized protein LOC144388873 isoform X5 [Gasterosteus aculeatus]